MTDTNDTHRFIWFDIMSKDKAATLAFYTELFGWNTEIDDSTGMGPYTMLRTENDAVTGVVSLEGEEAAAIPSHWMGYIDVEDIHATHAKLTGAGGVVCVPATEIPGIGTFSVINDPQGGYVSLLQSEEPRALPSEPTLGQVCWSELVSTDLEAGLAFYGEVFGWEASEGPEIEGHPYYFLQTDDGRPVGGAMAAPPEGVPQHFLHYICVEDVAATVERAKAMGAKLFHGPTPAGDGVIAVLDDPTEAGFGLWGKADAG